MDELLSPGEAAARLPGGLMISRFIAFWPCSSGLPSQSGTRRTRSFPLRTPSRQVLGFPMFHIEASLGGPLQRFLGDNHSLDVCMGMNALAWAGIENWFLPSSLQFAIHGLDLGGDWIWPGRNSSSSCIGLLGKPQPPEKGKGVGNPFLGIKGVLTPFQQIAQAASVAFLISVSGSAAPVPKLPFLFRCIYKWR